MRLVALAAASGLYVAVAWTVRPGFFDGVGAPNYDYVSPPQALAPGNVAPTTGSGTVGAAGGTVATRDQPVAQAAVTIPKGALSTSAEIQITPYAPPPAGASTLTGNVYCITSSVALNPGSTVQVALLVPPAQPFPNAMYRGEMPATFDWSPIGGSVDQLTYLMSASTPTLGCFAVGYPTPKTGQQPTLGGSVLPIVTAVLIAIVILAGLPAALRRRLRRRG